MTTKQQIINLLAEIQGWNDGDFQVTSEPRFDGTVAIDNEAIKARAKVIIQLQKLVNQLN